MLTNKDQKNLLELHERAVRASTTAVARIEEHQLDNKTPCSQWNLRALLQHMGAEDHGFAAAARGAGERPGLWVARADIDPVAEYLAAAEDVLAAFAAEHALERTVRLPGVAPGVDIPATMAMGFHLVDSVVHAWDVARAIGSTVEIDHELAAEALRIARAVPDDASRLTAGAAFAPALPTTGTQPALDQVLRLLGRSPDWSSAAV